MSELLTTTPELELPTLLRQTLTSQQAWHYRIIPKEAHCSRLCFYIDEEFADDSIGNQLQFQFDKEVELTPTSSGIIQQALSTYYRKTERQRISTASSENGDEDFVDQLILHAKDLGSSDIHIEVYDQKARVRMRVDGVLIERFEIDKDKYPSLINRVKIRANLDIAEKRLPQDGRIEYKEAGEDFDIRVSILPTLYGEKIVLRLLNRDATHIDLSSLGMLPTQLREYREGIRKPHGIVLISGPTGSGKTTTLYATLKQLNEERHNIMTVEDPIEYTLEGVNQVQLKESIGLGFAAALRSFLRQDPDVIMLGEIRDGETAEMAVRAALTGHLVLSTIHTNSAWGTISRLVDMGVPPFLLANTLNTSVAQRLVRKLCKKCSEKQPWKDELLPIGFTGASSPATHQVAVGCDMCFHTGYSGRIALYEVLPIHASLAEAVKEVRFSISDIIEERGIETLANSAFNLLSQGLTSLEEVYPLLVDNG